MSIQWHQEAKDNFDKVIENLPQFHRSIAQIFVKEKAQELAQSRNSVTVENQDLITAFFQEVPPAFRDMMKRLFTQQQIDYSQYIDE